MAQGLFERSLCEPLFSNRQEIGQAQLLNMLIVVLSHGAQGDPAMVFDHLGAAVEAKDVSSKADKVVHAELGPRGDPGWPRIQEPTHVEGDKGHCSGHVRRGMPNQSGMRRARDAKPQAQQTYAVQETCNNVTSAR